MILLLPGIVDGATFENSFVRYRWAAALRPLYGPVNDPTQILNDPRILSQGVALERGRPITLPFPTSFGFWRIDERDPYFTTAPHDFGPAFDEMDQRWAESLGQSQVTVRGRRVRLLAEDGRTPQILHVFRFEEIGNDEFWLSGRDFFALSSQLNCVSATFLVSEGYSSQGTVPGYGRCPQFFGR
ncbi:hypothetical protein BrevBR_06240 [Brevundimonas sp. BR2-1]|uniref:hypothetical protein n=1 Tax=Brevundimonas sp. BR2-1 TaxID=3031123 RepID=UPI0030B6247F